MKNKRRVPRKVVFVYSSTLLARLRSSLHLVVLKGITVKEGKYRTKTVYQTNMVTRDRKMLVVYIPVGAPITAATMEEIIAFGGKEFLILGTAGGLSDRLSISDIVLCTKAIRDEGTSHHYLKNSKYVTPDKLLTQRIEAGMKRAKIDFYKGTTWTIDAPYMETKEEVMYYRAEGVLTVEMEASAAFAVAKKRRVRAAAVFTVSDLLGRRWSGFKQRDYHKNGYPKLVEVAHVFKSL